VVDDKISIATSITVAEGSKFFIKELKQVKEKKSMFFHTIASVSKVLDNGYIQIKVHGTNQSFLKTDIHYI